MISIPLNILIITMDKSGQIYFVCYLSASAELRLELVSVSSFLNLTAEHVFILAAIPLAFLDLA